VIEFLANKLFRFDFFPELENGFPQIAQINAEIVFPQMAQINAEVN